MTLPASCLIQAADALGGPLTQEQLAFIREETDKLQAQLLASGQAASPANAIMLAARKFAAQQKLAAAIAKRNAAINQQRYFQTLAYVTGVWKGREAEGLRAVLVGSIEGRAGARSSAALEQKTLEGMYLGGLNVELERAGLFEAFKTGELDRDVARALWQLNSRKPNLEGIPKQAADIARLVHKYQEAARLDANRAGAWIGKLEGWIVRQSHDPWKIGRAEFSEWASFIEPRLDWARIEQAHGPIKDRQRFLRETYTALASGVHVQAKGATNASGFKGPRNIAKRMSQERILHFKDADAWSDYNERFGTGNIREAVFAGLRSSARNTGLMRVLGTNPEAMLRQIIDEISRRLDAQGDPKQLQKFADWTRPGGRVWNYFAEVDGSANIAVDKTVARVASNVRAIQSMAKLGGAVISSISDLATYASEVSFQGRGFLSGMAEALAGVGQGRPKGERQAILSSLGVFFESMSADLTRHGSLDESFGGWTSRSLQQFFKWNLLNWWTDALRSSAALSMSHYLALNAGNAWAKLPKDLRHVLSLFRITAEDWDHMRMNGVRQAADGRAYLVPDNLDEARARMLRAYITDRAYTAVLEPDAGTRASWIKFGTKPGTFTGELVRFVMQFKGFPIAFTRQVLGREVYGRGVEPFAEGSMVGLAQIIVATTVLGYGAMAVKDLLKGRTPRDPTDWKTILAAMTQGGGAGIYGDFLFGEFNRFGRTPLESAAGPSLGAASDTLRLWSQLVRGEADGGDALRLALGNTPFVNLFYVRPTLDYLILWDIQEAIAPGTLRRMQRRIERDQGQQMLISPANDRLRTITEVTR